MSQTENQESFLPESLFTPREFIVTRRMALGMALRLGLKPWLILLALSIIWLGYIGWKFGGFPLFRPGTEILTLLFGVVWFVLPAFTVYATWRQVRVYPQYDIPIIYQVHRDGLSSESVLNRGHSAWGLYRGWKEYPSYFMLTDGVRRYTWPKTPYSEEEVAALRRLFREKIR